MKLKKKLSAGSLKIICVVALFLSVAVPCAVAGNSIPPEQVNISTPIYRPNFAQFDPALGTYKYRVSWQGIGAAHLWVNVEKIGMQYRISTVAKTNSFIDVFYKLRYTATGLVSAVDLLPLRTVIEHRENSRDKKTELEFLPNGEIHSVRWNKGKWFEEKQFDPNNFTLDPFSAAFLARSLDWEVGQKREFDTFNGKSRYLITMHAKDKEKIKVNGVEKEVWVIAPTVRKLTETKPKSKLRNASIYVTADSARDILKIDSEVFVGSVITKLISFTPSSQPISGTRVASTQKIVIK
ncbi:DUF3108 domain-containing protein [Oligoflexia bacterium]|nr:DUF3108 domain-containing protein [Oligoflexia bacterium]